MRISRVTVFFCVLTYYSSSAQLFDILTGRQTITGAIKSGIDNIANGSIADKVNRGVFEVSRDIDVNYSFSAQLLDILTGSQTITGAIKSGIDNIVNGSLTIADKMTRGVFEASRDIAGNYSASAQLSDILTGSQSLTGALKKGIDNIVDGSKTIADKVHRGAFEVSKGLINGVKEVIGTPVNLQELTFHIVTTENPETAKKIDFYDPGNIWGTNETIFFIIHGWQSSIEAEWIPSLSKIFVTRFPGSKVVQVNWDKPASDSYPFSAFDTESGGNLVGTFISMLTTNYAVLKENIIVIGHSLGAQIAGFAGRKFQELNGVKLPRIIALDPAGPLFNLRPNSKRLNEDDAEVVMAVHTDAYKLGFIDPCGTIDFFPNGGQDQPGCWEIDLGNLSTYTGPVTCDHSRAWQFFLEAVEVKDSFPSRKCDSYTDFLNDKCNMNSVVAMGDLETKERGTFYLTTGHTSPYSKPLNDVNEDNMEQQSTFSTPSAGADGGNTESQFSYDVPPVPEA